ncbi:MAG TPA: HAMP domain-containing sensor histidine kinase [Thermoanaerobaculia bacterium]|nr:HAMP domain-containing sensor histidine kinase [Thermoanaerobaculia bacterium]
MHEDSGSGPIVVGAIAERAGRDLLAGMSHELRTPLHSVLGFAEMLADGSSGQLNARQAECVDNILEAGRRLLELVKNLLDLAALEAGSVRLERGPIAVGDLLREAVEAVAPAARDKGVSVELALEESIPPCRADSSRVRQVLLFLLSQAIELSPAGARLHVAAGSAGERAWVCVSDEASAWSSGVGLALSQRLVELHGGQLRLEPRRGGGSRSTLLLPLAGAAPDPTQ